MGLAALPDDILLQIVSSLSIKDVLALKQTCRVLHASGCTDYLWHRLAECSDLPLDIPADTPSTHLTADELQRLAIKAIRLQLNWRRPSSRIKRTTSLGTTSDALFELMHLVPGGQWLLTVQGHSRQFEQRSYTKVSLWSLANIRRPHCVIQFELMGKHRDTAVTMRDGGSAATFVVALHDGTGDFLHIRTVGVDESIDVLETLSPTPSVLVSRRLAIPPVPGDRPTTMLIEAVSVTHRTFVATVAKIVPGQEITSRILIADTDIGPARWMQTRPLQPLALPQARLHDYRIVVFGRVGKDFIVRVYELPSHLSRKICGRQKYSLLTNISRAGAEESEDIAWGRLLQQHQLPLGTGLVDSIYVPSRFTSSLAVFIVDDAMQNKPIGRFLCFHLDDARRGDGPAVYSARAFLPADTSIRLVGIGVTGCRAVWMEHSLETTRSRLMKMELGRTAEGDVEMFHGVLLPPDPPLPFSTDACHMLAFDEATCRLCLGLWDGSLHVVDFL